MTLEQFDCEYSRQKPYYEYWFGEPVQKSMPTRLHSILHKILQRLLDDAGYIAGAEIKLKISEHFQPLPDVIGELPGEVELDYPTKPVELVIEILSPSDRLPRLLEKCEFYTDLGLQKIYVIDPQMRLIQQWISGRGLCPAQAIESLSLPAIWAAFDREVERARHAGLIDQQTVPAIPHARERASR